MSINAPNQKPKGLTKVASPPAPPPRKDRPFKRWIQNRPTGFGPIHTYGELEEALEEAWDESEKQNPKYKSLPPDEEIINNKVLWLIGMENMKNACEDVMNHKKTSIEAKTGALNLQLAALRMSILIRENGFWKEEK